MNRQFFIKRTLSKRQIIILFENILLPRFQFLPTFILKQGRQHKIDAMPVTAEYILSVTEDDGLTQQQIEKLFERDLERRTKQWNQMEQQKIKNIRRNCGQISQNS